MIPIFELLSLLEDKTDEPRVRLNAAQILIKLGNISVSRVQRGLLGLLENKNEGSWICSNVARVLDDLSKTSATSLQGMSKAYGTLIKDAIGLQSRLLLPKTYAKLKVMQITILSLGYRGDVQPFIALGMGLQQAGHKIKIASQANFESEIRDRDLEFALISGNPKEAVESAQGQAMLQSKNPIDVVRRMGDLLEPLIETILLDSWQACQGTDAIIGGGFPFWGFDIAEKLGIPFYYAYLIPSYPTTANTVRIRDLFTNEIPVET